MTAPAADPRLIVALDLADAAAGLALADRLGDACGFYKLGLGMLAGGGLALARRLRDDRGARVFLDLKLWDIPATVAAAVRGLCRLGPDLLTVHGDPQVVVAAAEAAAGTATRILAVTVLTSWDRADLDAALIAPGELAEIARERAARALAAGAGGVVCSPREAAAVRALPEAAGRLIVTPGVRPEGAPPGDQKRVATAREALLGGADHVVVGRPVTAAPDPRAAARAIAATFP
jgi:orotidine-5'-phosphate decarboxylase